MKTPTRIALLVFVSLLPAASFAGEKEALQALVHDALGQREGWLYSNGYSIAESKSESIEVSTGMGTTVGGMVFSSAKGGNANRYFNFSTKLRKGNDRYTLVCRGYYTELHWKMSGGAVIVPVTTALISALDSSKRESFGSDCDLHKVIDYWFDEKIEVPKAESGKGLLSMTFDPHTYATRLSASRTHAEPVTVEARSTSERGSKGLLRNNGGNGNSPRTFRPAATPDSTERAL